MTTLIDYPVGSVNSETLAATADCRRRHPQRSASFLFSAKAKFK
ncbi:hypothetical protein [Mesorhizobium sp. 43Arga]